MDDLLRLPLSAGVSLVAYADDVTVLVEARSRSEIEVRARDALCLIEGWGTRDRLEFASAKSCTMTLRGRLQRSLVIRMEQNGSRDGTVSQKAVRYTVSSRTWRFASGQPGSNRTMKPLRSCSCMAVLERDCMT